MPWYGILAFMDDLLQIASVLMSRCVSPCLSGNGFVVDSQHFFTLDNRHFTFKGSCSYVLLQDVVDGNFTVVLSIDNGKFGSLLLADDKDSLELLADKSLLVNGERSEFPAHQGLLSAWRRYHWANLKSTAGVLVYVDAHTDLIAVTVSGFYHGRTRGLLGTLSYEPADDLIKPDGQFATKETEFGNSWKVGQCKDVTGHSHHDHETVKSSECSDKFTRGSTLSLCFPVLNPAPFREACDHAVEEASSAEAKKAAACAVASAYLYACSEDVPIILPSECAECKLVGGENPVAVGDLFSVKAPQRSADIVVVVEQVTGSAELYKELVGPLVTTLTNELKSKGVTDVHFHLVGFGGDLRWPTHYTSSGELSFNGKSKNLKFTTPAEPLPFDTRENKVRWFKHELQNLRLLLAQKITRDFGTSVHVIGPVDDLKLTGKDNKLVKQVVGFDGNNVFVLADAKKKGGEGNSDLRKVLTHKPDPCLQYPQNTYGTTFVSQNFLEARASGRKQFLQVVSHRLAEALTTELYEDCICFLRDGVHAETRCRVTGRKERERLEAKGQKGVKG
uniref:VWFD domain-containing protein n=1 Tax=Timema genevievae TaxID=629358 RepID=A0A7R9K4Q5_TIMGE|nr:unnamed protein product [Timema genevievae]